MLEPENNSKSPTPSVFQGDGDQYRQVELVKQGQRYVFRYRVGEEHKLLESLSEMARDPASQFDWFDAAVLSHQMGQAMGDKLRRMVKS